MKLVTKHEIGLVAVTIVAAIMRGSALERQSPHTGTQLRHGLQKYSTDACCVASNVKRKEKKEVLDTSNNESKVTQSKVLLPVRRPVGTSTKVFLIFQTV